MWGGVCACVCVWAKGVCSVCVEACVCVCKVCVGVCVCVGKKGKCVCTTHSQPARYIGHVEVEVSACTEPCTACMLQ